MELVVMGCITLFLALFIFPVEFEVKSFVVLVLLLSITLFASIVLKCDWLFLFFLALLNFYLLFYCKEYDGYLKWCIICVSSFIISKFLYQINVNQGLIYLYLCYLGSLMLQKRLTIFLFLSLSFFIIIFQTGMRTSFASNLAMCVLIFVLEILQKRFAVRFTQDVSDFQNQVISHQYEEVKAVYLNMRGWRHDYHNHIQTLKAYLSLNQLDRIMQYLNELEHDLNQVDQLVKSGNLMIDAILNSKLTLAKQHQIRINCKAKAAEKLPISDVDICVIVGNLMDNAIEACDKIPEENRFMRIYMDRVNDQLYLSIANSAQEELNFNQRHYISDKRGNHGHGMKRVKLCVDKYEGYLNLKNEPGVFVSELMIPLNEDV